VPCTAINYLGWERLVGITAIDRQTSNPLTRDFHAGVNETFLADVPNGVYNVVVGLGDPSAARDRVSVWAEGQALIANATTAAGKVQEVRGRVTVTDGQLTLRLTDGGGSSARFALNYLTLTPDDPNAPSLWPTDAKPTNVTSTDTKAVELGLRFQSTEAGYITGIRFYKGSTNTGTHTGSLWSASGVRLATATFTNETASGWQEVRFATPVAINANTTYTASYLAPRGRYSFDKNFFSLSGLTNGPLKVLPTSQGGGGVYKYGASGGFPTATSEAQNYWVDVVFARDTAAPFVSAVTPANNANNVATSGVVRVTFSEAMNPATVTNGTVLLQTGTGTNVPASVTYDAATFTATLTPSAALAAGSTYTVRVRGGAGGVEDAAGDLMAADFTSTSPRRPPC
jgi:hypothetical protein